MSLLCISFHREATNISKPSAPGVYDNMQRCKQQRMWDENILQELNDESIRPAVKDLFQ